MVPLPDGTFLILNGAHQGVAGFGLGTDPNLGAVLYDPTQPVNQRMSILNTTIVARMYHSEAILLPDARVLVSGSDPQDNVNPEEFRIEVILVRREVEWLTKSLCFQVYIPPYLAMGFTQPTYTLEETDWSYGGTYTVSNITLHQGQISGVRVSLVGGTCAFFIPTRSGLLMYSIPQLFPALTVTAWVVVPFSLQSAAPERLVPSPRHPMPTSLPRDGTSSSFSTDQRPHIPCGCALVVTQHSSGTGRNFPASLPPVFNPCSFLLNAFYGLSSIRNYGLSLFVLLAISFPSDTGANLLAIKIRRRCTLYM